MKKIIGSLIIISFVSISHAIPNYWENYSGNGGKDIYEISNSTGQTLTILCDEGSGEEWHSIYLENKGESLGANPSVKFLINGSVYPVGDTDTRAGRNNWSRFITEIKNVKDFDIYVDNDLFGTFNTKNTQSIFKHIDCSYTDGLKNNLTSNTPQKVNSDLPVYTANSIYQIYKENSARGNKIFKGKETVISGIVDDIRNHTFTDKVIISLKTTEIFNTVDLYMQEGKDDYAYSLRKGQEIRMKCIGDGQIMDPVFIKCQPYY